MDKGTSARFEKKRRRPLTTKKYLLVNGFILFIMSICESVVSSGAIY